MRIALGREENESVSNLEESARQGERAEHKAHRKRGILAIPALVAVLATTAIAAQRNEVQNTPAGILEQFCSLDLRGKRLTPAGAMEMSHGLLLTETFSDQQANVIIVQDYAIRTLSIEKDTAQFAIDYHELGQIDLPLVFTLLQTPYTNGSVSQSEHITLVLTDTHFELDGNGHLEPVKGVPQWRIKSAPVPHVSVMAAMNYVRGTSYRSKDLLLKSRVQNILAALDPLSRPQLISASVTAPSRSMPEDVLSQYIQIQMDGRGLDPHGSTRMGIFLVHPGQWERDKIGVAKEFRVKRTSLVVNKAEAYAEYITIGELDAQMRLTSSGSPGGTVREDYKLLFDNHYPPLAGTVPSVGPSRWRIETAPTEQWVSVAAAIQYVTRVRDTTRDAKLKGNADKTLAILKNYSN